MAKAEQHFQKRLWSEIFADWPWRLLDSFVQKCFDPKGMAGSIEVAGERWDMLDFLAVDIKLFAGIFNYFKVGIGRLFSLGSASQ